LLASVETMETSFSTDGDHPKTTVTTAPAPAPEPQHIAVSIPSQTTPAPNPTQPTEAGNVTTLCMTICCLIIFFGGIATFPIIYGTVHPELDCMLKGRSGTEYHEIMTSSSVRNMLVVIGSLWMCFFVLLFLSVCFMFIEICEDKSPHRRSLDKTSGTTFLVMVCFIFMIAFVTTSAVSLVHKNTAETDCADFMKTTHPLEAQGMPTNIVSANITILYALSIIGFIVGGSMFCFLCAATGLD
jgi:hypothetical protein